MNKATTFEGVHQAPSLGGDGRGHFFSMKLKLHRSQFQLDFYAVGIATSKQKKKKSVTLVYFGDGALQLELAEMMNKVFPGSRFS